MTIWYSTDITITGPAESIKDFMVLENYGRPGGGRYAVDEDEFTGFFVLAQRPHEAIREWRARYPKLAFKKTGETSYHNDHNDAA
jgi:hypothetical protein